MKRTQKWLVIAGALGSIFVVGFAAREMLFAQQNNRPQNDTWGPNSIPLPLPNPNARQIPMPAMVPPGTTPPPQARRLGSWWRWCRRGGFGGAGGGCWRLWLRWWVLPLGVGCWWSLSRAYPHPKRQRHHKRQHHRP